MSSSIAYRLSEMFISVAKSLRMLGDSAAINRAPAQTVIRVAILERNRIARGRGLPHVPENSNCYLSKAQGMKVMSQDWHLFAGIPTVR